MTIEGVQAGDKSTVISPDEESTEVQSTSFGPLKQTGFYELNNQQGQWFAACSLLSKCETLTGNADVTESLEPINRGASPAAWLTMMAIAVLLVEGILYHRRRVG